MTRRSQAASFISLAKLSRYRSMTPKQKLDLTWSHFYRHFSDLNYVLQRHHTVLLTTARSKQLELNEQFAMNNPFRKLRLILCLRNVGMQSSHIPLLMAITCHFSPRAKKHCNNPLKTIYIQNVAALMEHSSHMVLFQLLHWVRDRSSSKNCKSGLLPLPDEIPFCQTYQR